MSTKIKYRKPSQEYINTYLHEHGEHAVSTILYIINRYYPDLRCTGITGQKDYRGDGRFYPFETKEGLAMFVVENHSGHGRYPGQIHPHLEGWVGPEECRTHRWSGKKSGISLSPEMNETGENWNYDSRGKKVEDLMKEIDKAVPEYRRLIKI